MPPRSASARSTARAHARLVGHVGEIAARAARGASASNASAISLPSDVPATLSPRASAASAIARPSPLETPVISQLATS